MPEPRVPAAPDVRIETYDGEGCVTLSVGSTTARFLPSVGMLCTSLRRDGAEYVSLDGGVAAFREGHTTGIPLLHPWANRLSEEVYRAGRIVVDLRGLDIHRDGNGLPMHGTMVGPRHWEITRAGPSGDAAVVGAVFHYDTEPLLAAFPFPHRIGLIAALTGDRLRITTTIEPVGRRGVPVSFGFHPYFALPGVPRDDWVVELPACTHVGLDPRGIPDGSREHVPAGPVAVKGRGFDDHYELSSQRSLAVAGGGHRLEVRFGSGFPFAQVYAPTERSVIALEPMSATTDALVTGDHPTVAPGSRFRATFTILAS